MSHVAFRAVPMADVSTTGCVRRAFPLRGTVRANAALRDIVQVWQVLRLVFHARHVDRWSYLSLLIESLSGL